MMLAANPGYNINYPSAQSSSISQKLSHTLDGTPECQYFHVQSQQMQGREYHDRLNGFVQLLDF